MIRAQEGYNNTLSLERAEAIKAAIGAASTRSTLTKSNSSGFGEDRPAEDAPEEQPQNRRAVHSGRIITGYAK
jgi:outer membrane protein OmpA-like peptidoglycan-associated protein